ncbi:MAG: NAD-dependent epimerase/dehydratase family protein [Proteobacteria bacterium]|nr:NAD-dependent epimerase/dehydratase family protein [Pseudomonadota bacterium]
MAEYLVTGGCGFIGSHLADALICQGHKVRNLDDLSTGKRENAPRESEVVIGDVCDQPLLGRAMAGVDGCFHLAAIASVERSNEDWLGTHRVNLTGTIGVFDAAREARSTGPVPVVYISSAAVYGDNASVPLQESTATRPLTAYGADKLATELHARIATFVHSVPTIGFRLFNVYGPRQDPSSPYSGVISIFVDRIFNARPIDIYGDGTQVRDFVYVEDVVSFLIAGMRKPGSQAQVYNVCRGKATSIRELADVLFAVCGRNVEVKFRPDRAGDIRTSIGDPAKSTRHFRMHAGTELGMGLRRTLNTLAPGEYRLSAVGDLAASKFDLLRRDPGVRGHDHGRIRAEPDRR